MKNDFGNVSDEIRISTKAQDKKSRRETALHLQSCSLYPNYGIRRTNLHHR
jgi:hypothetical protein